MGGILREEKKRGGKFLLLRYVPAIPAFKCDRTQWFNVTKLMLIVKNVTQMIHVKKVTQIIHLSYIPIWGHLLKRKQTKKPLLLSRAKLRQVFPKTCTSDVVAMSSGRCGKDGPRLSAVETIWHSGQDKMELDLTEELFPDLTRLFFSCQHWCISAHPHSLCPISSQPCCTKLRQSLLGYTENFLTGRKFDLGVNHALHICMHTNCS